MGIGTSLLLIAVGAILKFAVSADVSGVSLPTIGLILMIVGGVGLLISLIWLTSWRDRRDGSAVARDPYVEPGDRPRPRPR